MTDADETVTPASRSEVHHQHRDVSGGWLRPTVFGLTDGLVSNFALIAGFAGGHAASKTVALAGLAGLVAGAFSMATGEYISVQSQNESTAAEVQVERRELRINAEAELTELTESYVARGVDEDVARRFAQQISRDPSQALIIHAQQELGLDPSHLPSPYTAAGSSFASFAVGAFVPLVPYLFGATSIWLSLVLSVLMLFVAGVATARFTARPWWVSAGRQVVLGSLAAAVTYGVGAIFHVSAG